MILRGDITINGKKHAKGSYISPWKVYPFFLFHMGMFGASGFFMAYFTDVPTYFLFMHGGIAIVVYLLFYVAFFGIDEVRWMFLNSALGIFGLYSEIRFFLSWFGKEITSYSLAIHVIPFLYYILYTFLLRQIFIEITNSRDDSFKRERVSYYYFVGSLATYGTIYLLGST